MDGEAIYVAPVNMTALLLVAAGYIESSTYGGKFLAGTDAGIFEVDILWWKYGTYMRSITFEQNMIRQLPTLVCMYKHRYVY